MAGVTLPTARSIARWGGKVGGALASVPGAAANAFANSLRGGAARPLTVGETAAILHAFGSGIDLRNVRIVDGPGRNPDAWAAFAIGGNSAIAEGDTVYIASRHYRGDLSTTPAEVNLLVHEFTHVRQFQQLGFGAFFARYVRDLVAVGDRAAIYDYGSRATVFDTETIEGQAAMVGDYAGYGAGEVKLTPAQVSDIERRLASTGIFGR